MNRHRRQQARQAAAEAAGRPHSRSPATRGHSHDLPSAFAGSGPAPLPSPTDVGFSPRTKEPSLSWGRDHLPPSPSSIASDHSLATVFSSARRESSSREATFAPFGPDISPRYHYMRRPITLPPIRAQLSERQDSRPQLDFGGHEPRIMPGEGGRSPGDSLAAVYQASNWERPPQPSERQYYHSHQLPPQDSQTTLALRPAREAGMVHQSDSQRGPMVQATRARDGRMSLSNLVG